MIKDVTALVVPSLLRLYLVVSLFLAFLLPYFLYSYRVVQGPLCLLPAAPLLTRFLPASSRKTCEIGSCSVALGVPAFLLLLSFWTLPLLCFAKPPCDSACGHSSLLAHHTLLLIDLRSAAWRVWKPCRPSRRGRCHLVQWPAWAT